MRDPSVSIAGVSVANCKDQTRPRRVLAIEIETVGHHPSYVRNFAKTWADFGIPGELDFLVTPSFFRKHHDEVSYVQSLAGKGIRIHSMTIADEKRMLSVPRLRYYFAWRIFCRFAREFEADHGLLMYSDYYQLPMLISERSPCPVTAIYFRPTYHYGRIENYRPTIRDRFKAWRKKWLMSRVLRIPEVKRILCLDKLAVDYMREHMKTHVEIDFLPDTFAPFPASPGEALELRVQLGIDPGRTVFTLLGILDRRKGVRELLQALDKLTIPQQQKVCILLVGRLSDDQADDVRDLVQRVRRQSNVQVILKDEFVAEASIQVFYEASDVILTTYQNHMGSSSALIRAALAGRPVLSSDYGLMGELVRQRKLGHTVDTGTPASIAAGLMHFIEADGVETFDSESALAFSGENTPQKLADCLSQFFAAD
jgi:glycosyltransferase involved in cell wall biosynthesis